jgi:hypothetical protein
MANQDTATESTLSTAASTSSSLLSSAVVDCVAELKNPQVECDNMSISGEDTEQAETDQIKESVVGKEANDIGSNSHNSNKKNTDHVIFRYRNKLTFKKKLNRLLSTRVQNSICFSKNREQQIQSKQAQLKMPILVRIELVDGVKNSNGNENAGMEAASHEQANNENSEIDNSTVIFNDYVLIPSQTNYKYLIHTVFESIKLSDKGAYSPLDGYLHIANWSPISLNSISKIVQCRPSTSPRSPLEPSTLIIDEKAKQQQHETTANGDECDLNNQDLEAKKNKIASIQYGEINQVNSKAKSCVVAKIASEETASEDHLTVSEKSDVATNVDDELASLSSSDENDTTKQVMTVYDMLSQVIGFACLSIRVVNK